MEAENEVQEEGEFREGALGWGEAQAHVEEEDGKADVRSWVEGGRSGRYQPGARRPIPGSVVTGESESEEPLGPAKWARMTRGRAAREVVMRRSLPVARPNPHHSLLLLPLDCLCAAVAPPCPRHPATRGAGRQPAATKTTRRRPEASFPNAQPILRGLVYPLFDCGIGKSLQLCIRTNPAAGGLIAMKATVVGEICPIAAS